MARSQSSFYGCGLPSVTRLHEGTTDELRKVVMRNGLWLIQTGVDDACSDEWHFILEERIDIKHTCNQCPLNGYLNISLMESQEHCTRPVQYVPGPKL